MQQVACRFLVQHHFAVAKKHDQLTGVGIDLNDRVADRDENVRHRAAPQQQLVIRIGDDEDIPSTHLPHYATLAVPAGRNARITRIGRKPANFLWLFV